MENVILATSVRLCANGNIGAQERVWNNGKIASVSDRVDLRPDSNPLQRSSEAVKLDGLRVDRENSRNVKL